MKIKGQDIARLCWELSPTNRNARYIYGLTLLVGDNTNKGVKQIYEILVTLIMAKEKTPQEASNIFHSIIKASVSKPATEKKELVKPKPKPKSDGKAQTIP